MKDKTFVLRGHCQKWEGKPFPENGCLDVLVENLFGAVTYVNQTTRLEN